MLFRLAFALALLLSLVGARPATPPVPSAPSPADNVLRLDAVLDSIRLARGVPGLAAAVVEGGRVVAIGVAGVTVAGGGRTLTVDDALHIGSCTQSMTALAIARLVEKRRLAWNTTLADAFPELMPEMLPVYRNVRLEQLLTHRGDIPPYLSVEDDTLLALNAVARNPVSARYAFVRRVVHEPPPHDAAGTYDYSNAGYTLAAAMVENVTGHPWDEWLGEQVFVPLGMNTAATGWPADKHHADRARGHRCSDSTAALPEPLDAQYRLGAVLGPGGDVHASIADLARYVAFHLDGERGRATKPVLARDTWRKLHEAPGSATEGYAMGWQVSPDDSSGTILFHDGTAGTFFARMLIQPAHDRAAVIVSNAGPPCGRTACEQALGAVLEWVKGRRK
jgi:CubicO group peptidase (beta-lactamase class C family)